MSALLEELAVPKEARRTACPGCLAVVLEVPLPGGLTVIVDAAEVLPLMRCSVCRSGRFRDPLTRWRKRGGDYVSEETYFTRDQPCWRCGRLPGEEPSLAASRRPGSPGPGWVGEPLTVLGAAISPDGLARPFLPLGSRRDGEAVHRAHLCSSVRATF